MRRLSRRPSGSWQELGAATLAGDYAKIIDYTNESIVKLLGGRAKAIESTEAVMKLMKAGGFTIKAYNVGEPGKFYTEGDNTFVVIPSSLELTFPGGRVIGKSYLLGISPDGGKTWKFSDGAGITKYKGMLDKVLPKLPADLKLPEAEKPEVIKDK